MYSISLNNKEKSMHFIDVNKESWKGRKWIHSADVKSEEEKPCRKSSKRLAYEM